MATDRAKLNDPVAETGKAQAIASRYLCEYVDLREGSIDHDLFRTIPVDLMFRYNFVPTRDRSGTLEIALADPRNLNMIDELPLLPNRISARRRITVRYSTRTAPAASNLAQLDHKAQCFIDGLFTGKRFSDLWVQEDQIRAGMVALRVLASDRPLEELAQIIFGA